MANLSDVIYKMIDNAHPVGSYYLTETDTNPSAILHVGTWVQLKDRMLIGCGDSFAISSEGGEITHTLTINEMPSHTHNFIDRPRLWAEQNTSSNDIICAHTTAANNMVYATYATGGDQPHNIMNPYHACFIWRRTA